MNHSETGIPDRSTFRHFLVRFDKKPDMLWKEYGYAEVATSRQVKWPKGMALPKANPNQLAFRPASPVAETLVVGQFLKSSQFAERLIKLGYVDVTVAYDAWLREQEGSVTKIPSRIQVRSEGRR